LVSYLLFSLSSLLILVVYERKPHSFHDHHFFQILTHSNLTKDLLKLWVLLSPSRPPASTSASAGLWSIKVFSRQSMQTATCDADRDQPISDLSHDDTSVRTTLSGRLHSSKFSFPIRSNLIDGDNIGVVGSKAPSTTSCCQGSL
jgi:hypothetical protein